MAVTLYSHSASLAFEAVSINAGVAVVVTARNRDCTRHSQLIRMCIQVG